MYASNMSSASVSYHRGKTAVKNNDGEKRLSFAGNTNFELTFLTD